MTGKNRMVGAVEERRENWKDWLSMGEEDEKIG